MGRLAVVEGVETVPQGFAIDRHHRRGCGILACRAVVQGSGMAAENPLHFGSVKAAQYGAHGTVGGGRVPAETERGIEAGAMFGHEAMHLAIRCRSGQNGKGGGQHHRAKLPLLALGAAGIGELRQKVQKFHRHESSSKRITRLWIQKNADLGIP